MFNLKKNKISQSKITDELLKKGNIVHGAYQKEDLLEFISSQFKNGKGGLWITSEKVKNETVGYFKTNASLYSYRERLYINDITSSESIDHSISDFYKIVTENAIVVLVLPEYDVRRSLYYIDEVSKLFINKLQKKNSKTYIPLVIESDLLNKLSGFSVVACQLRSLGFATFRFSDQVNFSTNIDEKMSILANSYNNVFFNRTIDSKQMFNHQSDVHINKNITLINEKGIITQYIKDL